MTSGTASIRSLLTLAWPIILTQLGMVFYGTVDILFVSHLGPAAIASVGLGTVTYFCALVLGMGILMGIDYPSSKAFGAKQYDICGQLMIHGLALAAIISLPLLALIETAPWVYRFVGVDETVALGALSYLDYLRWSIFPGLGFIACRQSLQSMDLTRPLLWALGLGHLTNTFFDYTLITGRFGAPALGIEGSAIATMMANIAMFAVLIVAALKRLQLFQFRFKGWKKEYFIEIFQIGMPAGLQTLTEVGIFAMVTALTGRLGAVPLASHQIIINVASMTFMVPLGISFAAAVRVGQGLGKDDPKTAIAAGWAAFKSAIAFMSLTALAFILFPNSILHFYTSDASVIQVGLTLLYAAAAFQIFDGIQIALTGALRGMGSTKPAFIANLIGHWLIGLPVGYWLCFERGLGALGLWIGLCLGLLLVSIALLFVWRKKAAALLIYPSV